MLNASTDLRLRLERVTADDRFADYCLWDYEPLTPPAGKLRSASLLWQGLAATGAHPRVAEGCECLREELGPFRTVWGLKKFDSHFAYEFYFYDYARLERTVSVPRVLKALRPVAECSLQYPDARPYFMFSLDLDTNVVARRSLDEISVYVGNPGSTVSSGICYNLSERGLRLDNFYFFFDAALEMDQIRAKIACSAHLDLPALAMDDILWPEMRNCGVIVVANKKNHDGIYFSRITVDQLLLFLKRMAYPLEFVHFVEQNRADLDHMLYDVGIDYRKTGQGLEVVKSAFYGLL
jgi:hypothetical protein